MPKITFLIISSLIILVGLSLGIPKLFPKAPAKTYTISDPVLAAKFQLLSTNGNTNCSQDFLKSIPSMADDKMLQGSCCGPMDPKRYSLQIANLQKYQDIPQIPADPYNISAKLAKELLGYNNSLVLTGSEQQILKQGADNSEEKGFCCCQCWRWYVHEGMAKYLVHEKGFTAKQITQLLNDQDGCGGSDEET